MYKVCSVLAVLAKLKILDKLTLVIEVTKLILPYQDHFQRTMICYEKVADYLNLLNL